MKDPRITWDVDHNTRAWTWEDWWHYRGVCACGHPSLRHQEIGPNCHGVIGRPRKAERDTDNPRTERRAENTLLCQCHEIRPVVLTRNSGAVFRRAIRPGDVHPFTASLGRTLEENILEWAPGFPRCEYPNCKVVGLINLQMYYLTNDRSKSVMACREHIPPVPVNRTSASFTGIGVPRTTTRPVTSYGPLPDLSFPRGVSGAELLRALGAPKAAENPELAAHFDAERIAERVAEADAAAELTPEWSSD